MDREDRRLAKLRAGMSDAQRNEMAEIISAEIKRREGQSSGTGSSRGSGRSAGSGGSAFSGQLSYDDMREVYGDMREKLQSHTNGSENGAGAERNGQGRQSIQQAIPRLKALFQGRVPSRQLLLIFGVVTFAICKLALSGEAIAGKQSPAEAPSALAVEEKSTPARATNAAPVDMSAAAAANPKARAAVQSPLRISGTPGAWSIQDKELLSQLDARRVELEKRREMLDARETEIKAQSQALSEKLAELRSLTAKLSETRQTLDARYDERLEQLANVYGSMQPKEAAPLIAKLDDQIALTLLERMPSKRLGQILSLMDSERAVSFTKQLTEKQKLK